MANCNHNEKEGTVAIQNSKQGKLNGHMYKQFQKSKFKRAKESDLSVQKKVSQSEANTEANGSDDEKTTNINISFPHSQQEKEEPSQSEANTEPNGSDDEKTTSTNISFSDSQQKKEKLYQIEGNTEPNGSDDDKTANTNVSFSHSQLKRVDFLLRQVRYSDHNERISSSEHNTQTKKRNNDILESQCDLDTSKVKEKLARRATTIFVEYWVPVRLSNVQMEQYCGSLFSNANVLCTSLKLDSIEVFIDILVSNRKCCDHPYLGDWSLCTSLVQGIPQPQKLDAEIKLSNKLLLFYKILLEIKKRGLRVLILYQTLDGSGSVSTGDILDDIIHEKFGEDSFVRIGGGGVLSPEKRRAALKTFNCKGSEKFVCLMETRACIPSIRLESVDTVIFFNSDWNPMNDLRALQKINLDSQFEQVTVFRLYSSHTVEEKLLILAKKGMSPEGKIINMKKSTCHKMLTWGASHLFDRLEELHNNSDIDSIISDEDSFVEDVFLELSGILPNNDTSNICKDKSLILEVQQIEGAYPGNISLLGEVENPPVDRSSLVKERPHTFWIKLLEGREFRWKYFSSQSSRIRKSVQRFEDLIEVSFGAETASKKCRTEAGSTVCQIPPVIIKRTRNKHQSRDNKRKLSGCKRNALTKLWTPMLENLSSTEPSSTLPPNEQEYTMEHSTREVLMEAASHVIGDGREQNLQFVCKSLEIELERLQQQKTKISKRREEMKQQYQLACEKEIDQIRKKYDTLIQKADMVFVQEEEFFETRYNKVCTNKSLAEYLMQRDNSQYKTVSQVATNDSMEELYQLISQWPQSITKGRSPQEVSRNLSTSVSPHISPAQNEMMQSLATYPTNAEIISRPSVTDSDRDLASFGQLPQRSNNSIIPFARNLQTSYVMRAPAPHLWHTWHPMRTLTPKVSCPSPGIVFSPVTLLPVSSNVGPRLSARAISWSLPSPFVCPY